MGQAFEKLMKRAFDGYASRALAVALATTMMAACGGQGVSTPAGSSDIASQQGAENSTREAVNAPVPSIAIAANREAAEHIAAHPAPLERMRMPTEATLIVEDGLSSDDITLLIQNREEFSRAIDQLAREAGRIDAFSDTASIYRQALTRAINGDGQLEALACGTSACMGTVRMNPGFADQNWSERLADDRSSPSYAQVSTHEDIGGSIESRFVISIDPSVRSIVGTH